MEPQSEGPARETEQERWQRNFVELLQELRVMQTGVQILFAFLLTLAFTGRFEELGTFEQTTYLVALLAAAASSGLIIAPVAYHRALFRRGRKPQLVQLAQRMVAGGLALVVVAMVGSVLLVTGLFLSRPAAIAVAVGTGSWFALLWGWLPWAERLRSERSGDLSQEPGVPP